MTDQIIEQFLTYVATADPGFPARLRGASDADISSLESFSDTPLPVLYRAFLRTMGEDDGGLTLMGEGTTNIQQLLELHRYWAEDKDERPRTMPPGFVLMGLPDTITDDLVAFDCTKPGEPPLSWVVAAGPVVDTYAESLIKLMYRSAFLRFVMPRYPESWILQYTKPSVGPALPLAAAFLVADAIGFRQLWFSDLRQYCGEMDDAVLSLSGWPGLGAVFNIRAKTAERVKNLVQAVEARLGPSSR